MSDLEIEVKFFLSGPEVMRERPPFAAPALVNFESVAVDAKPTIRRFEAGPESGDASC